MLSDRLKRRLVKDRKMVSVTLHIPADAIEFMETVAKQRGFAGHRTLLLAYISEGLRRDEAQLTLEREPGTD